MALKSRDRVRKAQEVSLLTRYEELRAECDRLRSENERLHFELEESERRLAASSNQAHNEIKNVKESTEPYYGSTKKITTQGLELIALVDDDCQVPCISEKWYGENISTLGSCLVLPVPGTYVEGSGGRLIRIKKQILVTLRSRDMEYKTLLLVVPQLNTSCVLGPAAVKALATRSEPEEKLWGHGKELEYSDCTNDQKKGAEKFPAIDSHHTATWVTITEEVPNQGKDSSTQDRFPPESAKKKAILTTPSRRNLPQFRKPFYKDLYWRFKTAQSSTTWYLIPQVSKRSRNRPYQVPGGPKSPQRSAQSR